MKGLTDLFKYGIKTTVNLIMICAALSVSSTLFAETDNNSIYQLSSEWTDQNNTKITLNDLAGKKQIVAMIYTHCLHSCPTIVSTMQAIERELGDRKDVHFLLVSLTPDSDTPQVLEKFAKNRKLNLNKWKLLTGNPSNVRTLSMALNIKYKSADENEVAHSNFITILDEKGQILFQELADINQVQDIAAKIINN